MDSDNAIDCFCFSNKAYALCSRLNEIMYDERLDVNRFMSVSERIIECDRDCIKTSVRRLKSCLGMRASDAWRTGVSLVDSEYVYENRLTKRQLEIYEKDLCEIEHVIEHMKC